MGLLKTIDRFGQRIVVGDADAANRGFYSCPASRSEYFMVGGSDVRPAIGSQLLCRGDQSCEWQKLGQVTYFGRTRVAADVTDHQFNLSKLVRPSLSLSLLAYAECAVESGGSSDRFRTESCSRKVKVS
jgi:hypothetical protein